MFSTPPSFIERVTGLHGPAGAAWLVLLPELVEEMCGRWQLRIVGPPMHGAQGIVIPVQRGTQRAALKLTRDRTLAEAEILGLQTWDGQGAVALLDHDPGKHALLLEWLDPDRSLEGVPPLAAAIEAGRLIRTLAIAAPAAVPSFGERAREMQSTLPQRWRETGRDVPAAWLERAVAIVRESGPASRTVMVNWDTHFGNVLAGERQSTRAWLAIDPMPVAADPELAVAPLLWTTVDRLAGAPELDCFLHTIVEASALDLELVRALAMARLVDYWLWGLGVGLTEDPVRCRRVIEWLALDAR